MTYTTPAALLVISILFPIIGIICVSARFYTRIHTTIGLWIDDWLTIPALILEIVLAGLMIWGASTKSLGEHLPAPTEPGSDAYLFSESAQQIRLQKIGYFFDFIGAFEFGLLKLSILFFYRKLFCTAGTRDLFDLVTMFMIVLVSVWTLTFGIGNIFLCKTHPTYAWSPLAMESQHCPALLPFLEGYSISDFIMDVLVWSLPIPKIFGLHMNLGLKLSVMAVFLVGILTVAASGTRMSMYIIFVVNEYTKSHKNTGFLVNSFKLSDGETIITYIQFWTMIESGLGVIVVCLPTLQRPLRAVFIKMSQTSAASVFRSSIFRSSIFRSGVTGPSVAAEANNERSVYLLDRLEREGKSSTSQSNVYAASDGVLQTSSIAVASELQRNEDMPKNVIHVQHEVEQH